ncbi:MAG: glycoside hydrolase family 57 protein [Candidatus Nomurabacteria bacterium]|jgi:alpha-amylase|nr:glycoside hydrolase family 57 protein [Candidatus Nomurabacteria bacterium]
MSKAICLYLHVHQPFRVREYSIFETGKNHHYFGADNEEVFRKVAEKSYLPTNKLLLKLLSRYPEFKLSLSISGTFIEQCEMWDMDVLKSFQKLVATGRVEIVAETYYHSLAFFYSRAEFVRQVAAHEEKIRDVFGVQPTAFRNTELSYNDALAEWADEAGYKAIIAEGWEGVLEWRSPNYIYRPAGTKNIRLLLKNYKLSDDLAFRFSDKNWSEYPLDSAKFNAWLDAEEAPLINLFMDYETFGEHQWADSGIFELLENLPEKWLEIPEHSFATVSEAADLDEPKDEIKCPETMTWADSERDLTAWLGNKMQQETARILYSFEDKVLQSGDIDLIADWRKLTTSDHAYYICTKYFNDGDVHSYFSPYNSPYDAFLFYANALKDIYYRINK